MGITSSLFLYHRTGASPLYAVSKKHIHSSRKCWHDPSLKN